MGSDHGFLSERARVIPRAREIEKQTDHFRFKEKTAASFPGRDRGGMRPRDASDAGRCREIVPRRCAPQLRAEA